MGFEDSLPRNAIYCIFIVWMSPSERRGRATGEGGLAPPTCRKTWLRLLWAGSPTKPSRMELASWSLTFFNKTLCTSGPPAAMALFPLAPREEGGTETRPRAGSLRLCPFPAISGHPHWPGCPSHWP